MKREERRRVCKNIERIDTWFQCTLETVKLAACAVPNDAPGHPLTETYLGLNALDIEGSRKLVRSAIMALPEDEKTVKDYTIEEIVEKIANRFWELRKRQKS